MRERGVPRETLKSSHGTRACYVRNKCRCELCRKANREYGKERMRRAWERAKQILAIPRPAPQKWTASDGIERVRYYKRACIGVNGKPCPLGAHLKKNSTGSICCRCREKLLKDSHLISANKTRKHLKWLSERGIGLHSVSIASDVSYSSLQAIRSGMQTKILPSTESRILAIDTGAIGDCSLVPAAPSWKLIDKLLQKGISKAEIARRLGYKTHVIQLKVGRITARNAHRISKVYKILMEELTAPEPVLETCLECGLSHSKEHRLIRLKMMLPCTVKDLKEAYPCVYPTRTYGKSHSDSRMAFRDLKELGAKPIDGLWVRD